MTESSWSMDTAPAPRSATGSASPSIPTRRPDALSIVAALWVVIMVAIVVRLLILAPGDRSLFPIYRVAGLHWLKSADLYPEIQMPPGFPLFRYGPAVAAVLSPLALLPMQLGDICWRLLNAGFLVGGLVAAARTLRPGIDRRTLAIFLALMIPPGLGHLSNGQCNALVIGLVLLAFAAAARDRWWWVAGLLTAATFLKLYPVAAAGLLILLYPRRLALRYAVAMAIGAALPFVLQSSDYSLRQYHLWFNYFTHEDRSNWDVLGTTVDFQLLLTQFGIRMPLAAYRLIEMVVGVAMGIGCLVFHFRGCRKEQLLTFALGASCVWMTVFGPATESPTYLILAPAISWGVLTTWTSPATGGSTSGSNGGSARWIRILMTASCLLLLSVQVAGVLWGPAFHALRTHGVQPLAGIVYLVALSWQSWDSTSRSQIGHLPVRRSAAA